MGLSEEQVGIEIERNVQKLLSAEEGEMYTDSGEEILVALAFPDVYGYGQPSLAIHTLYRELNLRPDTFAGRVFLPDSSQGADFGKSGVPLFIWENRKPIKDVDILGFSVPYETYYVNVLRMLELAQINLRGRDRDRSDPLVIAGGPCITYNPEPLAEFIDACVIGEAEEVIQEIVQVYKDWRTEGTSSREDLLCRLSKLQGVYVPSFYEPIYGRDNVIEKIVPRFKAPTKVARRWIQDLDAFPCVSASVTPLSIYDSKRIHLEIARGCAYKCRFCYLSYGIKKARQRSIENTMKLVKERLHFAREIKLIYPADIEIDYARELISQLHAVGASVLVGSVRADTLNEYVVEAVSRSGKSSLSIAPEAPEGRLRNFVNKTIKDDDFLRATGMTIRAGIPNISLFCIIGLPTETKSDIEDLALLIKKIRKQMDSSGGRTGILEVGVNPLFPKPLTPLQWVRMENIENFQSKLDYLRKALEHESNILIHTIPSPEAFIQGILSRGDRKLGDVLYKIYKAEQTISNWKNALSEVGLQPEFYFREREVGEVLPWATLDTEESGHLSRLFTQGQQRLQRA